MIILFERIFDKDRRMRDKYEDYDDLKETDVVFQVQFRSEKLLEEVEGRIQGAIGEMLETDAEIAEVVKRVCVESGKTKFQVWGAISDLKKEEDKEKYLDNLIVNELVKSRTNLRSSLAPISAMFTVSNRDEIMKHLQFATKEHLQLSSRLESKKEFYLQIMYYLRIVKDKLISRELDDFSLLVPFLHLLRKIRELDDLDLKEILSGMNDADANSTINVMKVCDKLNMSRFRVSGIIRYLNQKDTDQKREISTVLIAKESEEEQREYLDLLFQGKI